MNGEIRRSEILQKLQNSGRAISGNALAKTFGVSRQVIVQDIALLRAQGIHITPTNRGYLLERSAGRATRVFKVIHTEEEVEDELTRIVDLGGTIKDVFIYHRVYGVVRGELNIRSRLDVSHYMAEMHGGKSRLLSRSTSGYHYHTVMADSEEILDAIQEELQKNNYLAPLQPEEPVHFGPPEEKDRIE